MHRTPVGSAPAPAYPDLSRAPWALGLLAAGAVALSGCRTAGEPAEVRPAEESLRPGGVAPRVEPPPGEVPVPPPAEPPAAGIIPEVTEPPEVPPPPEVFRTAGVPREPTLPDPPLPAPGPPVEGDVVEPAAP